MFTYAQLRLLFARACSVLFLWFAISAPLRAQTNHLVHIGLGNQLAFTDADSGTSTTVVRPGDTVTWHWDYVGIDHTTSSGLCTPSVPGTCTLNGIWDSGFRFNPPVPPDFTRQFNDLGVFPYFCQVHGPDFGMRAKVVVLNGPDYELDITNNNNFFPPPPIPTITTLAGQVVKFNGKLFGFLGYNNLVNLSCTNGSPRIPDNCPAQNATPSPGGTGFNLSVGDSTAGNYKFNITGIGTDPANQTHSQQVQLSVTDLSLTPPSPSQVTVISGGSSVPITFQVVGLNNFSGFVNFLSCSGLPAGANCSFNPSFLSINPGFPQNVSLTIFTNAAPAGTYPLQIVANSNFAGTSFSRSQNLALRIVPADHFNVQVLPSTNVTASTPFNVVVTAADKANNPVQNYIDTVHFTSSDQSISASLPSDYTFTGQGNDNGIHSFPVTLTKTEPLTITATDTLFSDITGTSPIIRVQNGSPNITVVVTSSRAGMAPPHFSVAHPQDAAVTFTATVSALNGVTTFPDGAVRFFDGTKDLGTASLGPSLTPGQSTAVFLMNGVQHPLLSVGGHSITAVYEPGNGSSFTGDLSPFLSQPRSPAPHCDNTRCP
ncbi:MAG TPA: hypothetical protein VFA71_12575 [Terriglobales bacterium]|nr:hypothetical protein [Terriglobales bacterium]